MRDTIEAPNARTKTRVEIGVGVGVGALGQEGNHCGVDEVERRLSLSRSLSKIGPQGIVSLPFWVQWFGEQTMQNNSRSRSSWKGKQWTRAKNKIVEIEEQKTKQKKDNQNIHLNAGDDDCAGLERRTEVICRLILLCVLMICLLQHVRKGNRKGTEELEEKKLTKNKRALLAAGDKCIKTHNEMATEDWQPWTGTGDKASGSQ